MPYSGDARGSSPWDATTARQGQDAQAQMPPLPRTRGPVYDPTTVRYGAPDQPSTQQLAPRPGTAGGGGRRAALPPRAPRRWSRKRIAAAVVLGALVVILVLTGLGLHRLNDFGSAISSQPPFSSQTGFMSGAGRVNVVVMGYGGAGHDGAYLTDSMMVMSLVPGDGATTMISVPRDLWVQVPPNSGQYAKLNTAYTDGFTNGYNGMPAGRLAGGAEAAQKVSEVTGIPVTYWITIDFSGFRNLVDALGGIDINVPTAFTAQYPRNDNPQIDAGWKTIHFNTGMQHMTGEQAIEYARARYVTNPVSEGSDFARSARQQLLIRAIISRAKQVSAWPGLLDATNALQQAIYTNLSLTDLMLFSSKLDFNGAKRIGLTNQNVLVDGKSSDGQDVLQPVNGNWDAIKQYVAANLKS